jgi:hypothetical protein
MEQSLNALVFALVVAVVESAVRLQETGLWGSAFHADEAGFRRASSFPRRAGYCGGPPSQRSAGCP